MLLGAFFMFVAAVGIIRMPDLLMRMHAATKAGTLGTGLILAAVAVFHGDLGVSMRAVATISFLFLTAPVAAHMIGRAAYFAGVRLWEGTVIDELRGRYDERTHELESPPAATAETRRADPGRSPDPAGRED